MTFDDLLSAQIRRLLAPASAVAIACSGGGSSEPTEPTGTTTTPGTGAVECATITGRSTGDGQLSREPGYLKLPAGSTCPEAPPLADLQAADCCPVMEPVANCGLVDERETTVQPYYGGYTGYDTGPDEPFVVCEYDMVFEAGNACCGRPLLLDGAATTAPTLATPSDWCDDVPAHGMPAATDATFALAAAYWEQVAALEHASVASFGRVAMELLTVGAPADLVRRCHEAALDEVRHAQLAYGLVAALTGRPASPGALPLGEQLPLSTALADIAEAVVREGCIGETLASLDAAARLRHARGAVADALATIVDDEARHARLAWATLRWLLVVGGDEVAARVQGVFAEGLPAEPPALAEVPRGGHALGLLSDEERQQAMADGWRRVIGPALASLRDGLGGAHGSGRARGPSPARSVDA